MAQCPMWAVCSITLEGLSNTGMTEPGGKNNSPPWRREGIAGAAGGGGGGQGIHTHNQSQGLMAPLGPGAWGKLLLSTPQRVEQSTSGRPNLEARRGGHV